MSSVPGQAGQDPSSVPYDNVSAGPPISDGVDPNLFATRVPTRRWSYSSTLYSGSNATTMNEQPNPLASFAYIGLRQSGSSSIHDSFRALSPIPSIPSPLPPSSSADLSSTSSNTSTDSDNPSSQYTPQTESHTSHGHGDFLHSRRHGIMDGFSLSRPDDEEIEAMFQNIVRTRDLLSSPPLTIDQKWNMVEGDERSRWKDEKAREELAKEILERNHTGMIEERSPEWYLRKFLDRSINPKDASRLLVSLRTHEAGWFQQFIAMKGTQVLAQFISHINRKGKQRTEADHQLEYETLCCIRQMLNSRSATQDAHTYDLAPQIASSLNSPRLTSRKLVIELLTFLAYVVNESLNLVTVALETVSITNNVGSSPYAYWFAGFERSLSGRGKIGRLVSASEDVRKNAATESNINEYALSNLLLVNAILDNLGDMDRRLHHHSQMAAAGLPRVVDLCRSFNFEPLNTQLDKLQETIEHNEKELRERLDQDILRDMINIEDEPSLKHPDVRCFHCLQDIVGALFHCVDCTTIDIDICSKCETAGLPGSLEASDGGHDSSSHMLLKIPIPRTSREVQHVSQRAHGLRYGRDRADLRGVSPFMRSSSGIVSSISAGTVLPRDKGGDDAEIEEDYVHLQVCNPCGKPIVGIRYQCLNCPSHPGSYNLCSDCEVKSYMVHNSMHVFLKIPRPVDISDPLQSEFPIIPILYKHPAGPTPGSLAAKIPEYPEAYLHDLTHSFALCDMHMIRIVGKWYHCAYCAKDLCAECEALDTHDSTHVFLVFKAPVDMQVFRHFADLDNPADNSPPVLQGAIYAPQHD